MNESGAMGALDWLVQSAFPFLVVITIVVFVHELGHYLVARRPGIAADVFSVGFGRALPGFTDKRGTQWRLNAWTGRRGRRRPAMCEKGDDT